MFVRFFFISLACAAVAACAGDGGSQELLGYRLVKADKPAAPATTGYVTPTPRPPRVWECNARTSRGHSFGWDLGWGNEWRYRQSFRENCSASYGRIEE